MPEDSAVQVGTLLNFHTPPRHKSIVSDYGQVYSTDSYFGRIVKKVATAADKRALIYKRTFKHAVITYVKYRCSSINAMLPRRVSLPCRADFVADVDLLLRDDPKLKAQFMEACQAYFESCEASELDDKRWNGLAGRLGKLFLQRQIANERGTHLYFQRSGTQAKRDKEAADYRDMIDDVKALDAERALAESAA